MIEEYSERVVQGVEESLGYYLAEDTNAMVLFLEWLDRRIRTPHPDRLDDIILEWAKTDDGTKWYEDALEAEYRYRHTPDEQRSDK